MRLSIVLGTRPEIVKMSPIIKECDRLGMDYFIIHTGQHYSYGLDGIFFDQLNLPEPKYNLKVGSGTYAEEVSRMLLGIEDVLAKEKVDIVLVEGDTNSCMAGALASSKCNVRIGHIEAGLRSYFNGMPEEINRVLVDHCSDYLFAPTEIAALKLYSEGIPNDRIYVTGNTIVDAIYHNSDAVNNSAVAHLVSKDFILATVHRQENVDNLTRLCAILEGLEVVYFELGMPVIYPMHPRAKKRLVESGFKLKGVETVEPFGYFEFLWMEKNARLVLTDSGGVQEETCILGTPCVTLRDNTERPETVEVGANIIAGASVERIVECAKLMLNKKCDWSNPFGDGKSAQKIIEIIRRAYG